MASLPRRGSAGLATGPQQGQNYDGELWAGLSDIHASMANQLGIEEGGLEELKLHRADLIASLKHFHYLRHLERSHMVVPKLGRRKIARDDGGSE